MTLYLVTNGNQSNALDLNQLVYILQRQSGQAETGKYYLLGNGYANLANVGEYMQSLSRTTTPISVSIDQADQTVANNANTPATQNLSSNGFLVFFTTSATTLNPKVAGNYTLNF